MAKKDKKTKSKSEQKKDRAIEHDHMESWHAHDTEQVGVVHSEMKLVSKTKPVDKSTMLKGTDADPVTEGHYCFGNEAEDTMEEIRQKSLYNDHDRARPDNNQFFEKYSNPLSSKGN